MMTSDGSAMRRLQHLARHVAQAGAARPGARRAAVTSCGTRRRTASQRGWNGQPAGTSPGRGGRPGMTSRRPPCARSDVGSPTRRRGIARSSARVYGWAGAANTCWVVACSTAWPAYITVTSSATVATTPRSWVMSTRPMCRSRLDLGQQAQDLRLHGDVERRGRLVGDQHLGVDGEGDGDHHPLAHPARELVRVVADAGGGPRHLDHLEQLDRPPAGVAAAHAAAGPQGLGDLVAHGVHRVERGEGVLEDHRDVLAGVGAPLLRRQSEQVGAAKAHRAPDHLRRGAEQAHHGERADRLPAAGLADDRQRAPGLHRVRQAVDRVEDAVGRAELHGEVGHLQERRLGRRLARRRSAVRSLTAASGRARRAVRRPAPRGRARWRGGSRGGTATGRRTHRSPIRPRC